MSSLKDKLLGNQRIDSPAEIETPKPAVSTPASMADRIRQANKMQRQSPVNMMFLGNDVALLLDDSGSMGDTDSDSVPKIKRLNQGVDLFANEIDFANTKVTFIPMNASDKQFTDLASMKAEKQYTRGGTPMAQTIDRFRSQSANQGILISDGDADDSYRAIDSAKKCEGKRIDCIHIGNSRYGEDTLKQIAEVTGGMFFKFRDVASFAASLRELAPKRRAALANKSAEEIKFLTGASEVIK